MLKCNAVAPIPENSNESKFLKRDGVVKSAKKHWDTIRSLIRLPEDLMLRMTPGLKDTLEILSIPPAKRSDEEVKSLYQWIVSQQNISILNGMTSTTACNICREMELQVSERDEVVMHQGDQGFDCYILLTGRVSVYIRDAELQKQHRLMKKEAREKQEEMVF